MKQIILILALFSSVMVFGQNRELHIKTYEDGDISFWYKLRIELCAQIGLDSIQNSKNKWHFRLWTNKQAIDVWKDLNGKTFGYLIQKKYGLILPQGYHLNVTSMAGQWLSVKH